MIISSIDIINFRGIQKTSLKLGGNSPGRIVTLIGLNESGKTTVLEAISNFVSLDPETKTLVATVHSKEDPKTFIPKHRRGRFSDKVSVDAKVELTDEDVKALVKEVEKQGIKLYPETIKRQMEVEKRFTFEDSKLVQAQNFYTTGGFEWKKGSAAKKKYIPGKVTTEWSVVAKAISGLLPRMVYFPTFLFDLPDRIYLSGSTNSGIKNDYYRRVLNNALRSVDSKYSIEKHVIGRIDELLQDGDLGHLSNSEDTAEVDSVIRDLSNEISRVIMGAWKDIFGQSHSQQRIEMSWGVDTSKENAVYVEIYLISGQHKYLLRERSLGFRWFFSFLLFTQFRRLDERGAGTIFLFDEPASNLHSAAQMTLLESLQKIMGPNDYVIYSTHSHYMVNPLWLEKAYIVENKAVDVSDNFENFEPLPNDIVLTPYRRFVSENPTRLTYFQPVLDALHYRLAPMVLDGPAVILEGKYDYYPFRYLLSRATSSIDLKCFSANGASEMGVLISLFRGANVPFVIVLDDDKQGQLEKKRYRDDYHLPDSQVFTLSEADGSLAGKAFEGIYQPDVQTLIASAGLAGSGKLKAQGSAVFQLLTANGDTSASLPDTLKAFQPLLAKVEQCLAKQI